VGLGLEGNGLDYKTGKYYMKPRLCVNVLCPAGPSV